MPTAHRLELPTPWWIHNALHVSWTELFHIASNPIWNPPDLVLHLWCYRYISRIILDHSIIQIWIFNPESRNITRISDLNLPSRLVQKLVTSPLPDLRINRPTTVILRSTSKMCIILGSIMVLRSQLFMVTPSRQETVFLVAEQTTIHSHCNRVFLRRWGDVNIKALWHLETCRVIKEIHR